MRIINLKRPHAEQLNLLKIPSPKLYISILAETLREMKSASAPVLRRRSAAARGGAAEHRHEASGASLHLLLCRRVISNGASRRGGMASPHHHEATPNLKAYIARLGMTCFGLAATICFLIGVGVKSWAS